MYIYKYINESKGKINILVELLVDCLTHSILFFIIIKIRFIWLCITSKQLKNKNIIHFKANFYKESKFSYM